MCANNLFSNITWRLEMDHGNWRTMQISASTSHLSTYSFICGSSVIYLSAYLPSVLASPGAPLSPASPHLHWLLSAQSWFFSGMLNFGVPRDTVLRPCLLHLRILLVISLGLMSLNTTYTLMTSEWIIFCPNFSPGSRLIHPTADSTLWDRLYLQGPCRQLGGCGVTLLSNGFPEQWEGGVAVNQDRKSEGETD